MARIKPVWLAWGLVLFLGLYLLHRYVWKVVPRYNPLEGVLQKVQPQSGEQWRGYPRVTVEGNGQRLSVVVADTPARITQGLSDAPQLGADGMLFALPSRIQPTFWMLRMQFPLDFVWLDNGRVVDLHENVPAPKPGEEPVRVRPSGSVTHVLELPAGSVAAQGWQRGQTVQVQR